MKEISSKTLCANCSKLTDSKLGVFENLCNRCKELVQEYRRIFSARRLKR